VEIGKCMLADETVLTRLGYYCISCRASVGSKPTAISLRRNTAVEKPALHSPRLVL